MGLQRRQASPEPSWGGGAASCWWPGVFFGGLRGRMAPEAEATSVPHGCSAARRGPPAPVALRQPDCPGRSLRSRGLSSFEVLSSSLCPWRISPCLHDLCGGGSGAADNGPFRPHRAPLCCIMSLGLPRLRPGPGARADWGRLCREGGGQKPFHVSDLGVLLGLPVSRRGQAGAGLARAAGPWGAGSR